MSKVFLILHAMVVPAFLVGWGVVGFSLGLILAGSFSFLGIVAQYRYITSPGEEMALYPEHHRKMARVLLAGVASLPVAIVLWGAGFWQIGVLLSLGCIVGTMSYVHYAVGKHVR